MNNDICGTNREVYVEQHPGFRVVSGESTPTDGPISYGVVTDQGQGFILYENGNQDFVVDGTSKEVVGHSIKGEPGKVSPAKVIDAKNGDICLRAKNGTIYLEAANIVITGVDGKLGNIILKASSNITTNAATVTTQATNITIAASNYAGVVAGATTEVVAGAQTTVSSGTDVDNSSILTKILSWITKYKTFLSSICS